MSVQYESKHYHFYFDHVFGNKKSTGAKGKVYDLIADLSDRRGLRQEWEQIDGEIQDEIIDKWIKIIEQPEKETQF